MIKSNSRHFTTPQKVSSTKSHVVSKVVVRVREQRSIILLLIQRPCHLYLKNKRSLVILSYSVIIRIKEIEVGNHCQIVTQNVVKKILLETSIKINEKQKSYWYALLNLEISRIKIRTIALNITLLQLAKRAENPYLSQNIKTLSNKEVKSRILSIKEHPLLILSLKAKFSLINYKKLSRKGRSS